MQRQGHETRTDLYAKALAASTPITANDRMTAFFARRDAKEAAWRADPSPKLSSQPVEKAVILQHETNRLNEQGIITLGKPETDPRLDPNSPHYLTNVNDRLKVQGDHMYEVRKQAGEFRRFRR